MTLNPSSNPYRREGRHIANCELCGREAGLRCPRCGRPLCDAHAVGGSDRCSTCEAGFIATQARINLGAAITSATALFGWVGFYVAAASKVLPPAIALLFGMFVAGVLPAVGWGLSTGVARRRFLRQGDGEIVLSPERLRIAAATAGDTERRRVGAPQSRTQRGMPSTPIYQRTYGH